MSDVVIKVENLSKQYRLGELGTGTISHDLNRWWHKIRGKEDPYLKIGETNDRSTKGNSEYVWALRDINFEVKQGEVLGIIGKNGAGKSTLLKLLSRVTSPTTGSIKAKGRIASLLEVGTGFHEELTGKENIFLNGAILGMTKAEIHAKLDEIVAFSGTERYIDTPVKRYSSGMRVRLAFAVAAHLDPEILIVDEVLAVGDAEFQKKAIGKMQDISAGGGRTVLFVSHNMGIVKTFCNRGILLINGQKAFEGSIDSVVNYYGQSNYADAQINNLTAGPISYKLIFNGSPSHLELPFFKVLNVNVEVESQIDVKSIVVSLFFFDNFGTKLFVLRSWEQLQNISLKEGYNLFNLSIPYFPLLPGNYRVGVAFNDRENDRQLLYNPEAGSINVLESADKSSKDNTIFKVPSSWGVAN